MRNSASWKNVQSRYLSHFPSDPRDNTNSTLALRYKIFSEWERKRSGNLKSKKEREKMKEMEEEELKKKVETLKI